MPDGRVIAGLVLLVGLLALAAYFYFDHVKHGRSELRGTRRPVERLPLFGTDLLTTAGGEPGDGPRRPAVPPPTRPTPRPTAAPSPFASAFAPPAATAPGAAGLGSGMDGSMPPLRSSAPWSHGMPLPGAGDGSATGPLPAYQTVGADLDPALSPARAAAAQRRGGRAGMLEAQLHTGETLRFSIPDEGTLQFLPGRLEVVAGPDAGREIRFVRTPGIDPPQITFGRSEGPAYGHVQLFARTVSRNHARMTLSEDHWSLENESATNPVLLNGRPLAPGEVAPLLVEGDRIEMGEVVFVFHDR